MKKRLMILGSGGMAGHLLTIYFRKLTERYNVIDIARSDNAIKPSLLLDVTDFTLLRESITTHSPDLIINCIGLLNQNAEENPDQAILINAYLPHFLEAVTKNLSCRIIHISTDCVFSGAKGKYSDQDFKDGKGFYAQSKALGEMVNNKDLTIRTSIIGPELNQKGIGLFHWFSQQKGEIRGYTQAIWSGVTTIVLARAIDCFIQHNTSGLYQLTNNESISKYDLLTLFKNVFPDSQVYIIPSDNYKIDKSLLRTSLNFDFSIPSYPDMVTELREWIQDNQYLYPHYLGIIE